LARRTPQSFLKRQRELKRAEKARQKLLKREARKHGSEVEGPLAADTPQPDSGADESATEADEATPAKATDPGAAPAE
jgi:hypothetical protein